MPIEKQDPKDTRIYITIDKLNEVIDWCNNWENQWDTQTIPEDSDKETLDA